MGRLEFHTEKDLIERLQAGDQFAFEVLFYRYKDKVKGFVIKFAPSQIDADEIVQKVFIKVWIQRQKLSTEKSFSSFLYTIAKNEVFDQLRSSVNRRIYYMSNSIIADLKLKDPGNEEHIDMAKKLDELINKIPERRRQIFKMSRFDGFTYKQIASQLNISENTVDTQIRKALNFLRGELKEKGNVFFLIFFEGPSRKSILHS